MCWISKIAGAAAFLTVTAGFAYSSEVAPPPAIAKAGKIVFCSDISSPPLEYYDLNSVPVGSDIDIGREVAKRMGVKAEFKNTSFSAIIPALQAQQCDAILSQLFDKPARREVVDFVDYMYSAQSFLVPKGNPKHIDGLADISGTKIAVENGTTIGGLIDEQNKKFAAEGKPPASVVVFPKDTDALQALQIGQVDAYGTTLESAAYFLKKAGHIFDISAQPFNKITAGIATRKNDVALHDAIQNALNAMRADGSYQKILDNWGLGGDALE